MVLTLAILACLVAGLVALTLRGPDLRSDFGCILDRETASDAARPHPVVTTADMAALPAPVQRCIRDSGALGQPRPASLTVSYQAQLCSKPGAAPMTGIAMHYDRFDPPKRLFFMPSRMMGLPVRVLHDYDGSAATMRVRLAGLFNVVDAKGAAFSRTETVTVLNDLCLFAPGWLTDKRLVWTPLDDQRAAVTLANCPQDRVGHAHLERSGRIGAVRHPTQAWLWRGGVERPVG